MARENDLIFTLKDGKEVETNFLPPYSIAEQIAFEEKFRCSFVAVEQAAAEMRRAAEAADGPDSAVDPAQAFKVTWILWFGWRRARPKVAAKFARFVEEELEDWNFKLPESEKQEIGSGQTDANGAAIIDAEVVGEGTGDVLVDQMEHERAGEDGSLDPTSEPQPA